MKKISAFLILSLLAISSCGKIDVQHTYPEDPENSRKTRAGKLFGDLDVIGGKKDSEKSQKEEYVTKEEIAQTITESSYNSSVNKNLWIASLRVISEKMPILLIEKNAGLIITDWGSYGGKSNVRYKFNILVKGGDFDKNNLMISVFKQELKSGKWENVIPDDQIKEKIRKEIIDRSKNI